MTTTKVYGILLILLPFVFAFIVLARREGWKKIALEFAVLLWAVASLGTGVYFLLVPA